MQTTGPSLTGQLIELIMSKPVAQNDIDAAALFTLDAVANILAGRNSVQGRKLIAWARGIAPEGKLALLDPARQAFLLGALCHILEVDDLHRASVTHPGCVVVPAALILGRDLPGSTVLTSVLRGFEAVCRVGMAVGPAHYRIWHNTATCGPFGSALAAGTLLQLDDRQLQHALGNAGSQSAGLWEFIETGAETKHMHAGRAAEAGVVAAQLAGHDFTGAPAILEGARGFFAATCDDPQISNLLANPDGAWQLHQTSIKPWPSCRHTHPAIACALQLHQQLATQGIALGDIETIEVKTYSSAIDLCDRPQPDSVYAAKFSLQHCIAAALSDGKVEFSSFEKGPRARLAGCRSVISVAIGEPYASQYPDYWGSAVSLVTAGGQTLTGQVSDAKGDPEAALNKNELLDKAIQLLEFAGIDEGEKIAMQTLTMADDGKSPDIMALLDDQN